MWKDIPGWEGFYQVSDDGQIRSLDRTIIRNKVGMRIRGKLLSTSSDSRGYLSVGLYRSNRCYNYLVHRLVLLTFDPVPNSDNLQCNHKNGDKQDNRLCNLEWATPKQNQQHAIAFKLRKGMSLAQMEHMTLASSKARSMKVRCIDTGTIYSSVAEASKDLGISTSCIYESIRDGKVHNRYRFERLSRPKKLVDIVPVDQHASARKQSCPVICVETGQIFTSRGEAARVLNISESSVYDSLRDGRPHSGYTFQNHIESL